MNQRVDTLGAVARIRVLIPLLAAMTISSAGLLVGCHAEPDDVAGQAGELTDAVRRQNAIRNIQRVYTGTLADNGGDRANAAVKAVADASVEALTRTYTEHPEDSQNGLAIMQLLAEMRDARSLPALFEALNWRTEVNEEHAILAATTLQYMDVPADKQGDAIAKLAEALQKVTGTRGDDNRMRIGFIRALGAMHNPAALPALTRVTLAQDEAQAFLINRLAAQQLGELGDPSSVPTMIKALFLFAPNNPAMRMNDVAAEALVRIGRPSLAPLLALLRGEDEEANGVVTAYIEAIRIRDANAASQMSVAAVTSGEATFALGSLGFAESFAPLVQETQSEDWKRKASAAVALVRLNLPEGQRAALRDALKRVYAEMPEGMEGAAARAQLIAAMRHLYDPAMLPFFLAQAQDGDQHPQVRLEAVTAFAMLANKAESRQLRAFIASEPASEDGGYRENFAQNEPALAAADACDADVACWIGKLGDDDKQIVTKATYMVGRYGSNNAGVIAALVSKLDHREIEVRLAAVASLDHVAVHGDQAAIDKIEELRAMEEGRAVWNQFSKEALPTVARLRARMGDH